MNSVNKFAFFVEGLTEVLFIENFIKSILPANKHAIKTQLMRGGSKRAITITIYRDDNVTIDTEDYFLIINCNGENNIRSYIDAERTSLIAANYKLIVGLTDLYPLTRNEYHAKWYGHHYKLPQKDIPIKIIISVMETEAWFIAEFSHFEKINPLLNLEFILQATGLDLGSIDVEGLIDHPASQLSAIYKLVGEDYEKNLASLKRTIQSLNFEQIYFQLPDRVPKLAELVKIFNTHILK